MNRYFLLLVILYSTQAHALGFWQAFRDFFRSSHSVSTVTVSAAEFCNQGLQLSKPESVAIAFDPDSVPGVPEYVRIQKDELNLFLRDHQIERNGFPFDESGGSHDLMEPQGDPLSQSWFRLLQ